MGADTRFARDDCSLCAGPAFLTEPIDSQDIRDIADYRVADVLATLLALPYVRQINEGGSGWVGWTAAWERGDRLVLFEDVCESSDPEGFSSLALRCDCRTGDILDIWEAMQARLPGLWLYDPEGNATLQTLTSFAARTPFKPTWRTPDVVALAHGIRAEGAFDRLPILSDALLDAGCDCEAIVEHCRGPGPHAPGCWVIGLVLGNCARAERR